MNDAVERASDEQPTTPSASRWIGSSSIVNAAPIGRATPPLAPIGRDPCRAAIHVTIFVVHGYGDGRGPLSCPTDPSSGWHRTKP